MKLVFISSIFLLLLSGCNVTFVSRADNNKIYAQGSSCAASPEKAKEEAIAEITNTHPLIEDDLRKYIKVHSLESDGAFCYEAILTRQHWMFFRDQLIKRRQEIERHSKEYVKIFEYDDKDILIKTLLTERYRFNERLKDANSLAPMDVKPLSTDFKSLENSINVLPSVNIQVKSCNSNKNYQCDVGFRADVKDESNSLIYHWDFGEGSKSEQKNTHHRYEEEGSYSVSLQVTDVSGLSTFRVKDVLVTKTRRKLKVREKNSLKAYFILKKRSYKVGESVHFDNRSSSKGSKIKLYEWDLGDGSKSTKRDPNHTYTQSGSYVVKYKVCNEDADCSYASTRVKIVSATIKKPVVKAKPHMKKKATRPKPKRVKHSKKKSVVKTAPKVVRIDAHPSETIEDYIARKGKPDETLIKEKSSMSAYRYGDIWLLAKRKKISCAVLSKGFSTSLMGYPKNCRWHGKNAKAYMVKLTP